MKKLASIIFASAVIFVAPAASAEITGEVLSTDIGALIDYEPIKSYNINDYTYVIAEDLRDYGFDVEYNDALRKLSITRNKENERKACLTTEEINILKSSIRQREHVYDVYSTDIKTYLNGEQIDAYNVDGQTLIQIDHLARFGEFNYDNDKRLVSIDMFKADIDYNYDNAQDKQNIVLSVDDDFSKTTYTGQLKDGKPEGVGEKVFARDMGKELVGQVKTEMTRGYFKNGSLNGNAYTITQDYIGSDNRTTNITQYAGYKDGKLNGLLTQVYNSYYGSTNYTVEEWIECNYVNDIQCGYYRYSLPNKEYLYGFMIEDEGYYDMEGQEINYIPTDDDCLFSDIAVGDEAMYFIKSDGTIYGSGRVSENEEYKVPVKTDSIYKDTEDWEELSLSDSKVPGAVKVEGGKYGFLTMTDTGEVYFEYCEPEYDNVNLSYSVETPVKVMEGAQDIYCYGLNFYVLKNDGTAWYWDNLYYNTGKTAVADEYSPKVLEPVKVADDVKSIEGGAIIKNDNSLWLCGNAKESLKDSGLMDVSDPYSEKIMDDVKKCIITSSYGIVLKNDGTVWTWGGYNSSRTGHGISGGIFEPTQITKVYLKES